MDYQKTYNAIVDKRINNEPDGYKERHHILPVCMGGDDSRDNLVLLTAREHFICHMLLVKIHKHSKHFYPLVKAVAFMKSESNHKNRYFNSRLYSYYREAFAASMSDSQSGKKNSQYGTRWINNPALQTSRKIPRNAALPDGWIEGRIVKWDTYRLREKIKTQQKKSPLLKKRKNQKKQNQQSHKTLQKRLAYQKRIEEKAKQYEEWYTIYRSHGWEKFVQKTNYQFSQPNFVTQCQRYVADFKSQNGKKRGI